MTTKTKQKETKPETLLICRNRRAFSREKAKARAEGMAQGTKLRNEELLQGALKITTIQGRLDYLMHELWKEKEAQKHTEGTK